MESDSKLLEKNRNQDAEGFSENMNDLDYLYRMSFLVRSKIIQLDKRENALDEVVQNIRAKLMKINHQVNKKIRDISLRHITHGNSKFTLKK